MSQSVFTLMGKIGVDNKQAIKGIDETTTKADGAKGKIGKAFGGMGVAAKTAALGIGAAMIAAGAAAIGFAKNTADAGDAIHKNSQKMGVSYKAYQELDYWAGQNGISQANLEKGVGRLNTRMGEAAAGNEKYANALEQLGVPMDQVRDGTISTEDAFAKSIQTLSGMENEQEKAALASELFGSKLAQELLPALNDGSLSIEGARKKAEELGIVMSDDAVEGAAAMTDMMDDASRSFGAIGMQIGAKLMPILLEMLGWVVDHMPMIQAVIGTVVDSVISVVGTLVDMFKQYLLPVFQALFDWVEANMPAIQAFIGTTFDAIKAIFQGFVDIVGGIWDRWGGVIMTVVQTAFNLIKTIIETIMGVVQGIIKVVTGIIEGDWSKVWEGIKQVFSSVMNGIKDYATTYLEMLKELFFKIVGWIKTNTIDRFIEMKDGVIKWITDMVNKVVTWITELDAKVKAKIAEMVRAVIQWFADLAIDAVNKVIELKDGVIQWFTDMKDKTVERVKQLKDDVTQWFTDMKDDTIEHVQNMIDFVKEMPGKMKAGIDNGAQAVKNAFLAMWKGVVTIIKAPVNAVIGGANWILDKFGADKIDLWEPLGYAKGTDAHMGGPALVNDQKGGVYREAIQMPSGETFIPKGRNVLFPDMPRGTKVLPAIETRNAMQNAGIPRYKDGVGLWDKLKSGAGRIWDFAKDPLGLVSSLISERINLSGITHAPLDMAKGLVGKAKTAMVEWVKGLFDKYKDPEMFGGVGGRPADGPITSGYGWRVHPITGDRRFHDGVDIGAPWGAPVWASAGGRVSSAGWGGGYGNRVDIDHGGGLVSFYGHLSEILARVGQMVEQGQQIGRIGSTGASTGPHLHFGLHHNGQSIDPKHLWGYARGTNYANSGYHWVGEEGPELVNFKGGEQVLDNDTSKKLAGGITQHITINSPKELSPSKTARINRRVLQDLALGL